MNKTTRLLLWLAGWVFLLLVAASGLTALAVHQSRRHLEEYRAALEKRGEHLDVASLIPPDPPTDGNGARKLILAAKELGEKLRSDQIRPLQSAEEKSPGLNHVQHRRDHATVSGQSVSWEEVQAKLQPLSPLLEDIRELSKSPRLEIHPDYGKGFTMSLTGVTEALKAGQSLGSEGILFLRQGNGPAAVGNIRAILRLAGMTQKQSILISSLVTASLLGIAQTLTWELLQSSPLNAADLETLQREWSDIAITPSLVPTWRMERATALSYFELPSYGIHSTVSAMGGTAAATSLPKSLEEILGMGSFLAWATIYRHADEKQFIENYQNLIDLAPADPLAGPWTPTLEASRKLQTQLASAGIERLFSRMVLPTVQSSSIRIISTQALINLTVAALALQRYHLTIGEYPQSLPELGPAFLAAAPADPFDGNPMRYQRRNDGYLLYSIGPDAKDDSGDATKATGRRGPIDGKDIVWPTAAP